MVGHFVDRTASYLQPACTMAEDEEPPHADLVALLTNAKPEVRTPLPQRWLFLPV